MLKAGFGAVSRSWFIPFEGDDIGQFPFRALKSRV